MTQNVLLLLFGKIKLLSTTGTKHLKPQSLCPNIVNEFSHLEHIRYMLFICFSLHTTYSTNYAGVYSLINHKLLIR